MPTIKMTARLLIAGVLSVIALVLWASTIAQNDSALPQPTPAQIAADTHIVTRVLDGDTIVIAGGQKVRYIGIDTPEVYGNPDTNECFAFESRKRNEDLVLGKRVFLVKDTSETDKYGRLLRYIYLSDPTSSIDENTSINEILVREGFAHANAYQPDTDLQNVFQAAEIDAQKNKRGLWAEC